MFGAPGWRSPLALSDFVPEEGACEIQTQEMLAVDRFTGGGREGAKYNAKAVIDPVFQGRIVLDRNRAPSFALGLLALVLRDLKEGELSFGWGSAGKGYGRCQEVEIERWNEEEFMKEATESWQALKAKIDIIANAQKETPGVQPAEMNPGTHPDPEKEG